MTPLLIGHRGARSLYPENTLDGFRAAIADGVRHFETDIALTADGFPVLSHDPRLSPDLTRCHGRWLEREGPRIASLSFEALQAYDVGRLRPGSETARRFPRQRAIDGARIPALAEALRLDPGVVWTLEIKTMPNRPRLTASPERIVEAVANVVDREGAAGRVVIQSFDWRGPSHLRRQRPDLAYAWLTTRQTRAWRGGQSALPGSVAARGGGTWSPHHSELTPALLARAHAMGLRVVPWTVNDPRDACRLAAWGVDGIITDDPPLLAAALRPAAPVPPRHPGRS